MELVNIISQTIRTDTRRASIPFRWLWSIQARFASDTMEQVPSEHPPLTLYMLSVVTLKVTRKQSEDSGIFYM